MGKPEPVSQKKIHCSTKQVPTTGGTSREPKRYSAEFFSSQSQLISRQTSYWILAAAAVMMHKVPRELSSIHAKDVKNCQRASQAVCAEEAEKTPDAREQTVLRRLSAQKNQSTPMLTSVDGRRLSSSRQPSSQLIQPACWLAVACLSCIQAQ